MHIGLISGKVIPSGGGVYVPDPIVTANLPMGGNVGNGPNYSDEELPFLNILKQGGQQSGLGIANPWITCAADGSVGAGVAEQAGYLQLDSDNYIKSLTASPTPAGGQLYTSAMLLMSWTVSGNAIAPGALNLYPLGAYTFQGQGAGTFQFFGDPTTFAVLSGAITNLGGGQFQSTSTSGTWSITFVIPNLGTSNNGIKFIIQATDPLVTGNYLRNLACVETQYLAQYNAGGDSAIFHPYFMAMMANLSSLRSMKWTATEYSETSQCFKSITTTSAVLSAYPGGAALAATPWLNPTQQVEVIFATGEMRLATFTIGSSSIAWTTPLGSIPTLQASVPNPLGMTWAMRTPFTAISWSPRAPWEVICAFCRLTNANLHCNVGLFALFSGTSFVPARFLTPFNAFMQANLPVTSSCMIELCNETWNGSYQCTLTFSNLALWMFPTHPGAGFDLNRNMYGMACALMAQQCQTDWGANFTRCFPMLAWQGGNSGTFNGAMTCDLWFADAGKRASDPAYPIKLSSCACYFQHSVNGYPNTADAAAIMAQAVPLDAWFALRTTNVLGATTLTSCFSTGYMGGVQALIQDGIAHTTAYNNSTYKPLGIWFEAYEGGPGFLAGGAPPAGYAALGITANRDPRMGDDVKALITFWAANVGTLPQNTLHFLTLCQALGGSSPQGFGAAESAMQFAPGATIVPAKWNGIQRYVKGLP